jgi:hypothetical protein
MHIYSPIVPIAATPVNFTIPTIVSVAPVPIRNVTASPLPLPADLVKLNEKKNSAQSVSAYGAFGLLALLFLN